MNYDGWRTNGGVYLGYQIDTTDGKSSRGPMIRYDGDRHICWLGNSGAGKSRRLLLPNLAWLTGWSTLIVDVKGELMSMLHEHRRRAGSETVILNPFGLFNIPSRGYNPLAFLDPTSDEFLDDAMEQTEGLIQIPDREPHWAESAQDFVAALTMYVRLIIPGGTYADVRAMLAQSDAGLRRMISGGDDLDETTYDLYIKSRSDKEATEKFSKGQPDYNPPFRYKKKLYPGMEAAGIKYNWPEIGHKAERFSDINYQSREPHSIISTGLTQTRFLDSRAIKHDLAGQAMDFAEMKQQPMTIWLTLPDRRLHTHAKWLRLTLTAAIQALMGDPRPGKVPVAIILDDAAAIGHLPIIENTVAQMRGYGLKLLTIWQDLNQLKSIYKNRWESFVGNAGVFQSFSMQDAFSSEYISRLTGLTTRQYEQRSVNQNLHQRGAASYSTSSSLSPHQMPLMLPQDVRGLPEGHTVLFSDRFEGRVARAYLPYPTEIHGLEAICGLDPSN